MSHSNEVVILSAVRTPIGSFCGSLSSFKAHELGGAVIKESLSRANISPSQVSEVIFGHVLSSGQGQNPARQAAVIGSIPYSVPATLINMLCGSGLRSVVMGAQAIKSGDSEFVVCGGQESMSQSHHSLLLRNGIKMGDAPLSDTMITDGLTDAFNKYHMGVTAENIAKQYCISREAQDEFAYESQMKAAEGDKIGAFTEEILPISVTTRKGVTVVSKDEFPKGDTTLEGLSKLRPCFTKELSGTVTPGNSSGLNDGAASLILTSSQTAKNHSLSPLATIVAYAQAGVDPSIMGTGPIPAIRLALKKAGWNKDDVDLYELNEAFAVQSLSVIQELELDKNKINIYGGAIALGHPIGASGARVLVTLIYALQKKKLKKGVAALCVGGGMGIAICIELL